MLVVCGGSLVASVFSEKYSIRFSKVFFVRARARVLWGECWLLARFVGSGSWWGFCWCAGMVRWALLLLLVRWRAGVAAVLLCCSFC